MPKSKPTTISNISIKGAASDKTTSKKSRLPRPVTEDSSDDDNGLSGSSADELESASEEEQRENASETAVSDDDDDDGSQGGGDESEESGDDTEVNEAELMAGVNSSDSESESDEDEGGNPFSSGKSVVPLDDEGSKRIKSKLKGLNNKSTKRGVIYLGRIPHGFYEKEMKAYFKQFGKITKLRLSRNKKTGKPKHYAFIEFQSLDVAKIVADTMNNYLLFDHLLQCRVVPEDKVHPALFNGANTKFKVVPWNKIQRLRHNKKRTPEEHKKAVGKLLAKEKRKRDKLKELGIDYEFPGYLRNSQNQNRIQPLTITATYYSTFVLHSELPPGLRTSAKQVLIKKAMKRQESERLKAEAEALKQSDRLLHDSNESNDVVPHAAAAAAGDGSYPEDLSYSNTANTANLHRRHGQQQQGSGSDGGEDGGVDKNDAKQSFYCFLCALFIILSPFQYGYKIAELNSIQKAISVCQDGASSSADEALSNTRLLPYCLPMSDATFGLSTSMFAIGGIIGSLISGHVANKFGRLGGLRWNNVGLTIGSLCEGLAMTPTMLMAGRLISGISCAISIVLAPMYLSEIATIRRRGSMNMLNQTSIVIGILVAQGLGYLFNSQPYWRLVVGMGAFISVLQTLMLLFVVESPKYLASNGYILEARLALAKLRLSPSIDAEISQWGKSSVAEVMPADANSSGHVSDIRNRHLGVLDIWKHPEHRIPLVFIITLQLGVQLSGINMIFFYSSSVLSQAFSSSTANILTILLGICNIIFTFIGNAVVDSMNRRTLLLSSIVGVCASQCIFSFSIINEFHVLSALSMYLVVAFFAPGLGPLPFLLNTELFSTAAVGAASSYSLMANWFGAFLIAIGFLPLQHAIGSWVFGIFIVSLILIGIIVYFYLPETRGRSIENVSQDATTAS
ncbi:hypothetical protein H4219_001363 [Mycoemilia scoparia]|uniref:Major facilitator superfamily (MFS) profile domain-containing protein n=1 Tax=Mycoemilia scoparia TaxID=417184 RepID=A0A9W8A8E9_9FUNG|nr:hypothetical protein H4219_001363 [Mycoemilia scoparia]